MFGEFIDKSLQLAFWPTLYSCLFVSPAFDICELLRGLEECYDNDAWWCNVAGVAGTRLE